MAILNRVLSSLRNFVSDNGHTFYFASPGYACSKALSAATAATFTVPNDVNGVPYKAVSLSAGGNLYYVNCFATATGAVGSNGVSDLEAPAQLSLVNADGQTLGTGAPGTMITSFSLYAPTACTVFMRFFS
jgi:hypothetical protein